MADRANLLECEVSSETEQAAIQKVIAVERQLLQKRVDDEKLPRSGQPVPRGQHPKQHGCVRAEFVVAESIPSRLRIGVFREPGKTYQAWIRFSNALGSDDREPGGHGMAIKLMDVEHSPAAGGQSSMQTQDFVLLDSPVFFVKNALEFAEFDADLLSSQMTWFGKLWLLGYFIMHPFELAILLKIARNQIANPLNAQYWSVTPYALGTHAVKYVVKPVPNGRPVTSPQSSTDQLREAMRLQLQDQDASFDFFVQEQVDLVKEPIDDATHEWHSPLEKVATIRILRQSFTSPEQMSFGENLSFNPWHSLAEHRPLGSLNRLRRAVYDEISRFRHEMNHVERVEPTNETFPKP